MISTGADYEIRHYDSHLVAETTVSGEFEDTGTVAFGRLAGFIFGANSDNRKMKMTVPVTHLPRPDGSHRYRFVMERAYTEDTIPRPVDRSVSVVRVAGGRVAASGYRGGRGEARFRRAAENLLAGLERDGVEVIGEPEAAVYDGPFVPAPLRRNEILVPVAAPG